MVTMTWICWPEVTLIGEARVAEVNNSINGRGVVWVTHEAGLMVSMLFGLPVSGALFPHALRIVTTLPTVPVCGAVIVPLSTRDEPVPEPKLPRLKA